LSRTFTFNGPLAAILYAVILAFTVFLIIAFRHEPNVFLLFLIGVNSLIAIAGILTSYFRRLRISAKQAVFRGLRVKYQINLNEVKHYGIVRYRSFKFIYLSTHELRPFTQPEEAVVSSEGTLVIQFRQKPWAWIQSCIKEACPGLEAEMVH
jgi:hypothetical protein